MVACPIASMDAFIGWLSSPLDWKGWLLIAAAAVLAFWLVCELLLRRRRVPTYEPIEHEPPLPPAPRLPDVEPPPVKPEITEIIETLRKRDAAPKRARRPRKANRRKK